MQIVLNMWSPIIFKGLIFCLIEAFIINKRLIFEVKITLELRTKFLLKEFSKDAFVDKLKLR